MATQAEIKSLRQKRGAIKSSLTRFEAYINIFDSNQNPLELEARFHRFEDALDKFEECQSHLEILEGKSSDQEIERSNFESVYYALVAKAKGLLIQCNSSSLSSQSPTGVSLSLGPDPLVNVRLPPLNLPNFDGDLNKWLQFHDTFQSIIHNNNNLSQTQKFHYLISCLKGEALQSIQSLRISDSNYIIAWELICDRYKNTRIMINNHLKTIFDITPMKRESKDGLRFLLDELQKNMRSLECLQQPVKSWDAIINFIIVSKLDPRTKREWETSLSNSKNMPTYEELITFLSQRCQTLEMLELNNAKPDKLADRSKIFNVSNVSHQASKVCNFCKGTHVIYYCEHFLKLSPKNRLNEVRKLRLCINCLNSGHANAECKSSACRKCHRNHNTLLHLERQPDNQISQTATTLRCTPPLKEPELDQNCDGSTLLFNRTPNIYVLLPTVKVIIYNQDRPVYCRALLDSGSQSNYITKGLADQLCLRKIDVKIPVCGISQNLIHIKHATTATIHAVKGNYSKNLEFLVIDNITENLPGVAFKHSAIDIPENITLADDDFSTSRPIDLLLGSGVFWSLLGVGQISLGDGMPVLQKTKLGWIISGPISMLNSRPINNNLIVSNLSIEQGLERFWQVEECSSAPKYSKEQLDCEYHFANTTTRDPDENFVVSLPVRDNVFQLGDSRESALKQFKNLESRLDKNQSLKDQYHTFMQEYLDLGHMSLVNNNENSNIHLKYYMPHHPVIKHSSRTTKCRVVYNASCKTTSGLALNDVLKTGPTIQDELFSILCRFRCHNFVIIADVEKMYRMVKVRESDRNLQCILWRFDKKDPIQEYRLNTVTYGTAPASFLAIRSLCQIAYDNINAYPNECQVILKDFYVDDLISGASTIEDAAHLKNTIMKLLETANFRLRKWASNDKNILASSTRKETSPYFITDDKTIKTLGLIWEPSLDQLSFVLSFNERLQSRITKRFILSTISQIFDPLGLIGPVIVLAKLILQQLWKEKLSWDESVPMQVHSSFVQFYKNLNDLKFIKMPRHALLSNAQAISLHGFSDASCLAYGACIFLVSQDANGNCSSQLLCAKSRVAPLKTITLPRLELCGSLLLANLMNKVIEAFSIEVSDIFYWTDSTIVLAWLNSEPSTLKTFVANRVSAIQNKTVIKNWRHVRSGENPADIISRGSSPKDLSLSLLWWSGPAWLVKDSSAWPNSDHPPIENFPDKRNSKATAFLSHTKVFNLLEKFSSLSKLQRVTSYCMRFAYNCKPGNLKHSGSLCLEELEHSLNILVGIAQQADFAAEILAVKQSCSLPKKSKIAGLDPFLDSGLLRVGGRLRHSNLEYNQKHPLLLSHRNCLTKLIIKAEHERLLHAPAQAVLCSIRDRFWILRGKSVVRHVIRDCLQCFKASPRIINPKMGDLPHHRITPSPPFHKVGVDLAGPYLLKDGKIRNRVLIKAYLCTFVCFSTKALHLEIVNDLSSESFLNSFKRFVSRRGLPSDVFSDNGTNFVGAAKELQKLQHGLLSDKNSSLNEYLTKNKIQWHFIPPRAPHFGGLWEAAVKSCKYHLKRIVGDAHLTFEQFYTVLTQVEAILNFRPLAPLSDHPDDLEPLTPSHFLIGRRHTALPQRWVEGLPTNRLKHFERLQQLVQHFWRRWHREYLGGLQMRSKWRAISKPLKIGTMVLLKDENISSLQWPLGRVLEIHPGPDGIARVVTIKTSKGTFKRSITKVCPLPSSSEI